MHPRIAAFPSRAFYQGRVRDGANLAKLRGPAPRGFSWPGGGERGGENHRAPQPLAFVAVTGRGAGGGEIFHEVTGYSGGALEIYGRSTGALREQYPRSQDKKDRL